MMVKLLVAVCFMVSAVMADDISTLQGRMVSEYTGDSYSSAASYLSSQQGDGSWSDVNYASTAKTSWPPIVHLERVRQMAISYKKKGGSSMLAGVEKGLSFWFSDKPTSLNWWWNDIGQQLDLGPILIMVEDNISSSLVTTGSTYLNDPGRTGQNKVWLSTQTVWRGCLNESESDINKGLDAIKAGLVITTGEGIQVDGTFYQHHEQLYNGGYGKGYVNDVGYWIYLTRGLSYAYSQSKMDILSTLVLDGTQWMIRRGRIDPSCNGRNITRPGSNDATGFLDQLDRFESMGVPRSDEYSAMADHIRGTDDGALVGNKHFWRSDYQAHRRSGYFMSVKMCSKRTYGTELINSENLHGRYLPFGCTYILVDGNEYYDIFPVWDWSRIPGVTAPYAGTHPGMPGSYVTGTTDFVGGASNGVYGAAVLDFSYDNVTAKKSWFFFEEGCMALGAGITGTDGNPVYTSVNQCLKSGDVTVSTGGAGSTAGSGQQTISNPAWAHHDQVGYLFPGSENVVLKNEVQNGSWEQISSTQSDAAVSKDVVSLWFDHGTDPSNGSYSYAVLPGMSSAEVQSFAGSNPMTVVSNTSSIQAVRHTDDQVTGIIFHAAGQVDLGNGTTVKADQACAMVVDESGDTAGVTVSNPMQTDLTVTVDLMYSGKDDVQYIFNLKSGSEWGGRSITLGSASVVDTSDPGPGPDAGEVIASSDDGNVPENTLDGDFDTRWSANGTNEWIRYDLLAVKTVSGIQIATYRGDERRTLFSIDVSENAVDWVRVMGDTSTGGATLDLETFLFGSPVNARYVRINANGNSANDWNSYTEVRIDTVGGSVIIHDVPGSAVTRMSGSAGYFDMNGSPVPVHALRSGMYVMVDEAGRMVTVVRIR